jgi:predicted flap endonuclease-1-like 5' DNA nuclease
MIRTFTLNTNPRPPDNDQLAARLDEIAELLDAQQANPHRAQAYRTAALTIRGLPRPVHEILAAEGTVGLTALPGIGTSLARSLERLVLTGRLALLEQLRGVFGPEDKLASVPGIGPKTAARIHQTLGIETLADLQAAAYDGRLSQVPGLGTKRLRAIRESLTGRFRRPGRVAHSKVGGTNSAKPAEPVPVEELLSVDDEYRVKTKLDRLLRIAPRRFNPDNKAWLPILHTRRGKHEYTALFSNSARAHEFDALHDWVIIYRSPQTGGGQWTAMTSRFGDLQGRRIIRGLERECAQYYERVSDKAADFETRQHGG